MSLAPEHIDPQLLDDAAFLAKSRDICTTKAPYQTKAEASAMVRRFGFLGTPYRCTWCGSWHLTTYDRAAMRRFRRRLRSALRNQSPETDAPPP